MPERVDVTNSSVRTDDWPAQATDSIVKVVGTVHDKVTGPVMTVARALVFGLFATVLASAALLLAVVLGIRLLNNYLPDSVFGEDHVWAAYLIIGVVLTLVAALVLWPRRKPARAAD